VDDVPDDDELRNLTEVLEKEEVEGEEAVVGHVLVVVLLESLSNGIAGGVFFWTVPHCRLPSRAPFVIKHEHVGVVPDFPTGMSYETL